MKNETKVLIGSHEWTVKLLPQEQIGKDLDGYTIYNDFTIEVRDDLKPEARDLVLRHEIVHAVLGEQGRVYQKTLNLEDVCEFIAWNLETIKGIFDSARKGLEEE